MDRQTLYRDIAGRTGGDIYIGVVGPVRTGKSAFIQRFLELAVLPEIEDRGRRERVRDEAPQSGAGRTIMTSQPRFVPDEAVELTLEDGSTARVRLADCAGYLVEGAIGTEEDGASRMVRTPWYDRDIPFEDAAELGTRKVIADHSTIALVVTTDGSFTGIPRDAYAGPEERVVRELRALGKPFAILLNCAETGPAAQALAADLAGRYGVPVRAVRVPDLTREDLLAVFAGVLGEFPIREARVRLPSWLGALPEGHPLWQRVRGGILAGVAAMKRMKDAPVLRDTMAAMDGVTAAQILSSRLNDGVLEYEARLDEALFYRMLGESCGQEITGEENLFALMTELAFAKREYDRIADALLSARATGYGLIAPAMEEMALAEPSIVRQGGRWGVKLKATAPSLHLIRADVQTEVSPVVGSEQQSQELVKSLLSQFEADPARLWQTDIFGKPLSELVREGLSGKLARLPDATRGKVREALEKIINENTGGMVCILL